MDFPNQPHAQRPNGLCRGQPWWTVTCGSDHGALAEGLCEQVPGEPADDAAPGAVNNAGIDTWSSFPDGALGNEGTPPGRAEVVGRPARDSSVPRSVAIHRAPGARLPCALRPAERKTERVLVDAIEHDRQWALIPTVLDPGIEQLRQDRLTPHQRLRGNPSVVSRLPPRVSVVVQTLSFTYDEKEPKHAHYQCQEGNLQVHPPNRHSAEAARKHGASEPAEHRMSQEPPAWPQGWPIAPQVAVDRPKRPFEYTHNHAPSPTLHGLSDRRGLGPGSHKTGVE